MLRLTTLWSRSLNYATPDFEAELDVRLSAVWRNRKMEIHNNLIQQLFLVFSTLVGSA